MASGYGSFTLRGETFYAHRFAAAIFLGAPMRGPHHVMHTCDNPPCVNPRHLRIGTNATNTADRNRKGRQARGSRLPQSKMTPASLASMIREVVETEASPGAIAEHYGVTLRALYGIASGRAWSHQTTVPCSPKH